MGCYPLGRLKSDQGLGTLGHFSPFRLTVSSAHPDVGLATTKSDVTSSSPWDRAFLFISDDVIKFPVGPFLFIRTRTLLVTIASVCVVVTVVLVGVKEQEEPRKLKWALFHRHQHSSVKRL